MKTGRVKRARDDRRRGQVEELSKLQEYRTRRKERKGGCQKGRTGGRTDEENRKGRTGEEDGKRGRMVSTRNKTREEDRSEGQEGRTGEGRMTRRKESRERQEKGRTVGEDRNR